MRRPRDVRVQVPVLSNREDYTPVPDYWSDEDNDGEVNSYVGGYSEEDELSETDDGDRSDNDSMGAREGAQDALDDSDSDEIQEHATRRPGSRGSIDDTTTNGARRSRQRSLQTASRGTSIDLSEDNVPRARYPARRLATRGPMDGFVNSASIEFSDDEARSSPKISYEVPGVARPRAARAAKRKLTSDVFSLAASDDDELSMASPAYRVGRRHRPLMKQPRLSDLSRQLPDEDPNRRTSSRKKVQRFGNLTEQDIGTVEPSSEEEDASSISAVRVSKPVGPKEVFKILPYSDRFRMRHAHQCNSCGGGESHERGRRLVFCQGCQCAWHHVCLGNRRSRDHLVTRVGESEYVLQCRFCIGSAHRKDHILPHLGRSAATGELAPMSKPLRQPGNATLDDIVEGLNDKLYRPANVMFRCTKCNRAWRWQDLPARTKKNNDSDESSDGTSGDDEDHGDRLAETRYREYARQRRCDDCQRVPEIETLVGWRPKGDDAWDPDISCGEVEESRKEYLVKWKKLSYQKITWMSGDWVWGVALGPMRKAFLRKHLPPSRTTEDAIPEDFHRIDIIFDVKYEVGVRRAKTFEEEMEQAEDVTKVFAKYKGTRYEDSVWESPPAPEQVDRWQDFLVAYEDWVRGHYISLSKPSDKRRRIVEARHKDFARDLSKKKQPASLTGGTLLDYQLDGLNWLYYMWYKRQNAILADEMGLGKTIQVIALLALLLDEYDCWPFLIVCPNSTVANWRREAQQWAPSLRVTTYFGSAFSRDLARQYQLFADGHSDLRCHAVITSYEAIIDPSTKRLFQHIPWQGLVVDEGQRLKNDANIIYTALNSIDFPFKLLLTGTPLQNNIRELFNLLQFLDPNKSAVELAEDYSDLDKDKIDELHEMLRPFILRRTKETHLSFLPPMAAIIVPVSMTILQKKLYKNILEKNPALIRAIFNKQPGKRLTVAERSNLNNIMMQLRKCLCHPFVYSRAIEDTSVTDVKVLHRNLTEASAKLKLLELLLPKLKQRGHRVLLFSQFLENLDIIEDFLDGLGLMHCRIDGNYSSLEKQKQIDRFNAKDSPYFAFMLSTRAGGVGINLATADTVIILDPDFNPHQDMQALARAHRIGQKNKVLVFKLMTQSTVEEKIMQIGKKKMLLDHVLIERLDQTKDSDEDLEAILKHGATEIFQDKPENDIHYDDAAIDRLLDRSAIQAKSASDDKSPESQFSFARVWKNDSLEDSLDSSERSTPAESVDVWDKILQERERAAAEAAKAREELGRGKRTRQKVNYSTEPGSRVTSYEQGNRIPTPEVDDDFVPEKATRAVSSVSSSEASDFDGDVDELLADKKTSRQRPSLAAPDVTPQTGPPKHSKPTVPPAQPAAAPKGRPLRPSIQAAANLQSTGTMRPALPSQPVVTAAALPPKPTVESRPATPMVRAQVPELKPTQYDSSALPCPACANQHATGACPLKLAGVEHCGLCGEAHYGSGRTCSHLRSEEHLAKMIKLLRQSTEDKALRDAALKYLTGVLGDVRRRKKLSASAESGGEASDGAGKRRRKSRVTYSFSAAETATPAAAAAAASANGKPQDGGAQAVSGTGPS
ncbi:hypothetical protein KEM52_004287 [Ascosphaera acerosa]|nr:hypothetical protein KEM52_004287 [Ascosphaera acerosa]